MLDDEFWAEHGLMEPEEDASTPEEVAVLREFVEAYNTANALPADSAARRLMSLCEDRVPCDGPFDKGERTAWLLWDAGIAMPHHQRAILALVDAVQTLPRLEATPEQESRFGAKLERWRAMEDFWQIWDETYSRYREYCYPADRFDGDGFPGFVAANAFMAHRLATHPPGLHCTVELSRALRQILFTLEQDPWNHASAERKAATNLRSSAVHEAHITMLNTHVHALVPFLEIAGDIIYKFMDRDTLSCSLAQNDPENTRQYWLSKCRSIKRYPEADLWKGDVWMTRDRWAFWRQRLVWISGQEKLQQRTRAEASTLAQLMGRIEEEMTTRRST
ncbi:hypothetical protein VTK56DRAFT_5897 [Thermocarpiscus australiensis]